MLVVLDKIKGFLRTAFNTRAAGLYILLFAIVIGVATFIENDFGTSAAQKVIFKTWWFELLLVLFSITILVNISKFRMIQQKKWTLLIFHFSFIIILIGAGITRYFSFEGTMHIREGEESNWFLSSENYIKFRVLNGGQNYEFDEKVLFVALGQNNFDESYKIGADIINVKVKEVIPNPKQTIVQSTSGKPTLKIVIGGAGGREEYFVKEGESKVINGLNFNFTKEIISGAFNVFRKGDSLFFVSENAFTQMTMATQQLDTLFPSASPYPLKLRSLYSDGENSFVIGDYFSGGDVKIVSEKRKIESESVIGIKMDVTINGKTSEVYVTGQSGQQGIPTMVNGGNTEMAISYGAKPLIVPFKIKLKDFIMDRYPGTNSAASYASEVTVVDDRDKTNMDFRIFMNNILDYDGYRFFQSSFDQDEKGTYLSVNHDFLGTWVSYIGYILLTLGLALTLVSKKTRFYQLSQKIKELRTNRTFSFLIFFSLFGANASAQQVVKPAIEAVSAEHAELFSKVVVQDVNGRMKPMHTLTRELLRKVSGSETYDGLNADRVILGMFTSKQEWYTMPLVKLGPHTKKLLKTEEKRASYKDFFDEEGNYKIQEAVRKAYDSKPIDRGTLEKELIKIDERVNITGMIFSGGIFKIIPIPNDPNNTWTAGQEHGHNHGEEVSEINQLAASFFSQYQRVLHDALHSKDYSLPNKLLIELSAFQEKNSAAVMPSSNQMKAEIFLNNLDIFGNLAFVYVIFGLVFLFLLFFSVFKPNTRLTKVYKILLGFVFVGFLLHTVGLGLRWYISGRAPWSNGYESLIYIAWTTTLAGLIFTRKSIGGLTATMILAATVLLIAKLSYLDPEITPLVPVLNSYWLTIHVSLEAGSYGFLMLGAIIGLINLLLMVFLSNNNKEKITGIVTEMSYISEMTLIGGITMLSIGTYLGGVWANESWGRYWGWDAKETWALVSILVYAFILHMRIIPKMNGLFTYNVATLFGLSSVVMTYFGVNYYLSGLHSYAAGDPVPVPTWVYVTVVCFILISVIAYFRKKSLKVKM
jgi:cytochrome c-type biogenesis protein CcsB